MSKRTFFGSISAILSLLFVICLCVPAFAENATASAALENETDGADINALASKRTLLINIDTSMVLCERAPDEEFYCGFLPNVMTCLILMESEQDLTKTVTVSSEVLAATRQVSSAGIKSGDTVSLEDLVKAALISNSQEACNAIAFYVTGGGDFVSDFVAVMNNRARELGAVNTVFSNVNSFSDSPSSEKNTTLNDVAVILQRALAINKFDEYISTAVARITVSGKQRTLYAYNSTVVPSSQYYLKGTTGLGIYSSSEGGYCSASMMTTKNMRVLAIASDTVSIKNVYNDLADMVEYASEQYTAVTLLTKGESVCEMKVLLGKDSDFVVLTVSETISALLPKDFDTNLIKRTTDLPESVEAPLSKGDKVGTIILSYNGKVYGSADLVTKTGVELDNMEKFTSSLNAFFTSGAFLIIVLVIVVLIIIYTLFIVRRNRKKAKEKRSRDRQRLHIDID